MLMFHKCNVDGTSKLARQVTHARHMWQTANKKIHFRLTSLSFSEQDTTYIHYISPLFRAMFSLMCLTY